MTSLVQIVAIAVSTALLLLVLELVRRRRLTEEYSFIWIACTLALLGLSIWRDVLHAIARWLGVFYPPAVLLLVLTAFVFVGLLYFSVTLSRQRAQIERLIEDVAILEARLRDVSGPDPTPGEPGDASANQPGARAVAAREVVTRAARQGQQAGQPRDSGRGESVGEIQAED